MNYLAHLYLAGNDDGLLVGNFIADAVRGREFDAYPEPIRRGILMHRHIDTFTDAHPIVEESKSVLRNYHGKYAPVVADIIYDYFLAVQWKRYSATPLQEFSLQTYTKLALYRAYFPLKSKQFYDYMLRYDILTNYAQEKGLIKVFRGMSQRAEFFSNMEKAVDTLQLHQAKFNADFDVFFPDLIKSVLPFVNIDAFGK